MSQGYLRACCINGSRSWWRWWRVRWHAVLGGGFNGFHRRLTGPSMDSMVDEGGRLAVTQSGRDPMAIAGHRRCTLMAAKNKSPDGELVAWWNGDGGNGGGLRRHWGLEDGGGVTERSFVDGNDPNSRTAMASGLSLPGCASILATSVHSVSLALSRNSSAEEKLKRRRKRPASWTCTQN